MLCLVELVDLLCMIIGWVGGRVSLCEDWEEVMSSVHVSWQAPKFSITVTLLNVSTEAPPPIPSAITRTIGATPSSS